MSELVFDWVDARVEPYAASPTLQFRLRIAELTGVRIHTIALRCQLRIEPIQRQYTDAEGDRLVDLFGERPRWADTLKPMQLAMVPVLVPGFTGSTEVEVPVSCSYDLELAAVRYFDALDLGEVPLLMLFSGTIFTNGLGGYAVEQVPWHAEARYRLPVALWRELMDRYFPNSAWLRMHRDTLAALARYKSDRAIPTWDEVLLRLVAGASAPAGRVDPVREVRP